MKAVVTLSGGLDSTVALAHALEEGDECSLLAFNYGQRHQRGELAAADAVAKHYGLDLTVLSIGGMRDFGESSLLNDSSPLPENRDVSVISGEISSTYVPARNLIFLSLAASFAESIDARKIVVGFNYNDARGFPSPDGRLEFVRAFELALLLGTKAGVEGDPVRIDAPLIHLSKTETVTYGAELGAPMHLTRSCFAATERECESCDACRVRRLAFYEAGIFDRVVRRARTK